MHEAVVGRSIGLDRILEPVRRFWGFDRLRPLQEQAIRAGLDQRDSVVVLPTGGGKSLCYQVPPLIADRTDVVVSPLISLMKDQVDALRACGYPAAALHSNLSPSERDAAVEHLLAGRLRLVFVSPERILTPWFLGILQRLSVRAFAIDEAHCISHWGHDFRPEYRQLATLKERFPQASLHAYTATATERVRGDIVEQLKLNEPAMLVGTFDRPNLAYRVVPRVDAYGQVIEVVRRHADEAVIVYCLSRKDAEAMAEVLRGSGIHAEPYHAGLSAEQRRRTQDAFADESLNVVTATVAFGMGIDRSNVRCIIHATMPKSVEHYQQETGRAGRDGLEAECVLLYSAADVMRWQSLIRTSAEEMPNAEQWIIAQVQLLERMKRLAASPQCRHRALSEYFGQAYPQSNCQACDVCLDEAEGVEDATVIAQKILSCVARVEERFGVGHVVDVLGGADTEQVRRCGHEHLSTYGLLKDTPRKSLMNWVYQLVDQGLVERTAGDRPLLKLNEASWAVLRGQRQVKLMRPRAERVRSTAAALECWEGVDRGLFEHLRTVRRRLAQEQAVPAFVIFSDASLRDMARRRPGSAAQFRAVHGVGEAKQGEFGPMFLSEILAYCREHGLSMDVGMDRPPGGPRHGGSDSLQPPRPRERGRSRVKEDAFQLFAGGAAIDHVAAALERARSTVAGYLEEFIQTRQPESIDPWVDRATYQRVAAAIRELGADRLKPVFEHLGGGVPYDQIRLVMAHLCLRIRESSRSSGPRAS